MARAMSRGNFKHEPRVVLDLTGSMITLGLAAPGDVYFRWADSRFAELLTVGLYLVLVGQAGRITFLSEDEAAVAEGRRTGKDDGQRQRLADQIPGPGPDMFAEQEHAKQAGRQRIQYGEPGLRRRERPGRQRVRGQQHRRRSHGDEHVR